MSAMRTKKMRTGLLALAVHTLVGVLMSAGRAEALCTGGPFCLNFAPTLTINNGAVTVDEGAQATNSGTFDDTLDSFDDTVSLSGGVNAGEFDYPQGQASGEWIWRHTPSDSGNRTVIVRANDSAGKQTDETFQLTINNVAPTAKFNHPGNTAEEGGPFALSLTEPNDPSPLDRSLGFSYRFDCGDGAGYGPWGRDSSRSCPADNHGGRDVRAAIRDNDGGERGYAGYVFVNNVTPTAKLAANPQPVDEGGPFALSLTDVFDPSPGDTAAGFVYRFDCGDGAGVSEFGDANSRECQTNDSGWRIVKGNIHEKNMTCGWSGCGSWPSRQLQVRNVAPTANFEAPAEADAGRPFAVSLSNPQDPSSADRDAGFEYACDCGAGYGNPGSGSEAACTAGSGSSVTVKAKIVDKDGGETEYTKTVALKNPTPANTAPVVSAMKPASGKTVKDPAPLIGATVSDEETELQKANVTLYVDGRAKTFSYSAATDRLTHKSPKLRPGRHAVKVVASDGAGETTTEVWGFRVGR